MVSEVPAYAQTLRELPCKVAIILRNNGSISIAAITATSRRITSLLRHFDIHLLLAGHN